MTNTQNQTPAEGTEGEEFITPKNDEQGTEEEEHQEETEQETESETESPKQDETPKPPEVDYKKKFSESTRQNQIIVEQFKNLQNVLGDITKQEVPSEEEMKRSDPEWEYLTDREKTMAMKMVVLEKRSNSILKTIHDISLETENSSKLQQFINGEPRLKGKEDSFFNFATKPSNKGVPAEILLNAFLFEVGAPDQETPEQPEGKAPSFERGSPRGGVQSSNPNKQRYSDEELASMRTNDHKQYMKLVREGKI
jgi:hypothetical protein